MLLKWTDDKGGKLIIDGQFKILLSSKMKGGYLIYRDN